MVRLKMYHSLYGFCSRYKNVLDFTVGEKFVVLEEGNEDENWCYAVNNQGNIGYIPKSYIEAEHVSPAELMNFVEEVLKLVPKELSDNRTNRQKRFLMQLTEAYRHFSLQLSSPNSCAEAQETVTTKDGNRDTSETNSITVNDVTDHVSNSKVPTTAKQIQQQNDVDALDINKQNRSDKLSKTNQSYTHDNHHDSLEGEEKSVNNCEDNLSPEERIVIQQILKEPPIQNTSLETSEIVSSETDCIQASTDCTDINQDYVVPMSLVPSLIEKIRSCTNLSHKKSQLAIAAMLNCFKSELPLLMSVWTQMEEDLTKCKIDESILVHGEDRKKLEEIFRQLWYCRNDEQQRSWPVHEDEAIIKGHLEDLYRILLDADPRISCQAIQADDYEALHLLVTYYQMEPRRSLRITMLKIFIILCELDQVVIDQLLSSILPMELARDMQSTTDDLKRLQYSAYLLTLLFCTELQPSNYIYEYINEKFLEFLLDTIEESNKGDESEEAVGDQCLAVLLAVNHHHKNAADNPVLSVIKNRLEAKVLTEKLMLLINREDDPTKLLSCCANLPNSVMKMLNDLFTTVNTVQLFYLNDIKVLIDIIIRQLTDLPPGDNRRCHYLNLIGNIISNSSYDEHCHQQENLQKCFWTILSQEEANLEEQIVIRNIIEKHSTLFSLP